MKRNLLSLKITLLVFCGVIAFSLPSQAQTAIAPSGIGTSMDPYQIGSLENLYWIAENTDGWDDYYQQTANIDASATSTWFSGEGWSPIGNNTTAFTGNYEGEGYTISGLFINRSGETNQGLFGKISSGYVANLGFDGADITASSSAGCIGGYLNNKTVIFRCWTVNSSVSADTYAGAIAGNISGSDVKQCYANVTITAPTGRSGCLVGGASSSSTLENCYTQGSIDATPYAGGIVGYYDGSQMINCYSTAFVDGYGGGLIGINSSGVVDSCYWDIETSGQPDNDGGTGKTTIEMKDIMTFVNGNWDFKNLGAEEIWNIGNGRNDGYPYLVWQHPGDPGPSDPVPPSVMLESISDITSTTATANGNITLLGIPNATQHGVCWNTSGAPTVSDAKTEDGIATAGTYSSYITGLMANTTYHIRAYAINDNDTAYSNELTIIATEGPLGYGSEDSPYQITSLADLFWMSNSTTQWNIKYWVQTADIDASETSTWNGGQGFSPIGNNNDYFYGSYNGNHYKISGLTIDRPTMNYVGLFGDIIGGTIEKLYLENVLITGKNYVAGLVGSTSTTSVIDSCSVQGTITGEYYTGGFCGRNIGNISNSSANATVNGIDQVGVFVGSNFTSNASIMNSFSKGSVVSGNNQIGGFVGSNSSGYIENCYSRADVVGDIWCGGFVGDNYYGEIHKSYCTGSVSGNISIYGFSALENNSTNTDCFWDTETSGLASSPGGTGKTTSEMKALATYTDQVTTGLSNAWDFTGTSNDDAAPDDFWAFAGNLNDGYPLLRWEFQMLSYEVSTHGSISGITPQYIYEGEDATAVEAVPDEGYHFVEWSDGSTDNPRTDLAVMEDVAVTASFAINIYTLSYTAGENGTLIVNISQDVEHGSDGTAVEAIPNTGYHFVDWSDGVMDNPRTDENVTADITVTANFEINTYTLTYTADDNGSITGTSPQEVVHGANGLAVTAVPYIGYHFAGWSDGGADNPRTDENVTADIIVTANFEINTYTLTYTADDNGSITGTSPQEVVHGANGSAITAVPYIGYHFAGWSDGVMDNPRTDENVTADITVTANFEINTYTLTYTADDNGSITGTNPQEVEHGADGSTVNAVPATGYHFAGWSDGETDNPRTDENVTADITVTANFEINTYTLTYTADDNGSITGTSPQEVVHGANGLAVTAVPYIGYHFAGWSDGGADNPRTDENVTADIIVTANFEINTYTLTYTADDNGSITGTNPQEVEHGADGSTVNAVPATGYHFAGWSDGETDNPRTDENVTADITVTANFEINTYTLTYTADDNGSITGTNPQEVEHGADGSTVNAVPATGYHFAGWSDGETDNPRTDENVTADINVTANFTEITKVQKFSWSAIEVYPNPFGASLRVNYPSEVVELKLLNIIGQTMQIRLLDGAGKTTLSTQELQPGIYLLLFINEDGDVYTRRLLKK